MSIKRMLVILTIVITGFILQTVFILFGRTMALRSDIPEFPSRVFIPVVIFLIGILTGLAILIYYFPEIRPRTGKEIIKDDPSPLDVVKYMVNPDENLILSAINKLGQNAYQYEIAKMTELPRMKVHRNLKKLVDKGVIELEKEGKMSKAKFADWLNYK